MLEFYRFFPRYGKRGKLLMFFYHVINNMVKFMVFFSTLFIHQNFYQSVIHIVI